MIRQKIYLMVDDLVFEVDKTEISLEQLRGLDTDEPMEFRKLKRNDHDSFKVERE
ncbi:hypothetical protein [Bacillus sp. USDA818B3_A]|uniref:hypothetical protein n=1 Tax=Bacillus sp. USDA818B3_A TaxID=2698834 RepID=UPI00136A1167|nr:hypothetical protein [Bacillus sp. USDA818B3_A]